jgi:hypothetical protein
VARRSLIALMAVLLTSVSLTSSRAQSPAPVTDFTIVSGARVLSAGEVQAADITATVRGRSLIEAHAVDTMGLDVGQRAYAAYDFGQVEAVLDVTTPFMVVAGSNELGQEVKEIVLRTAAISVEDGHETPGAGPTWSHAQDASATILAGDCWKRVMWWTVMVAPGTFDGVGPGSAFRVYGRVLATPRAGAGCEDSEGFRRAWMEFSPGSDWSGAADHEPAQPDRHIGGGGDPPIRSVGFGPIYATDLGSPPSRVDGSPDLGYGGVIDQRWAAWRTMGGEEPASGGVRWCLFFDHPTPEEVSFATRVSAFVPAGGTMGGVEIRSGQDAGWEDCPPPD